MPPLPRTAAFRLVLASLALAAVPPSAQACKPGKPVDFARCLSELETGRSHETATSLLNERAIQDDWKRADPQGYQRGFRAATELVDLGSLLTSMPDARSIRLGLQRRPDCMFCNDPSMLEKWYMEEFGGDWDLDSPRVRALREATWAWEHIPAPAVEALKADSIGEKDWAKMDFKARSKRLREWGKGEFDALMKTTPRTRDELGLMNSRALVVNGIIGDSDSARLWERVNRSLQAVTGLERAAALFGKDPSKRGALDAARGADLDEMLAGLGKLFDGAGDSDPAFRAAVPATAEQAFSDDKRAAAAAVLADRLMKETEGTYAGEELRAFYGAKPKTKANTLDVRIEPAPPDRQNWIGWHQNGVITFNEKHVIEYLKGEGKSVDDLMRDPALLGRLARQLTPMFVHEATHQRQYAWQMENGLPNMVGQNLELETMQVETLFIVEKSRRDPAFKKQLEADRNRSMLASESISKAERLALGAPFFRDTVNAWHYPELLSLEGVAWCRVEWHKEMAADIDAEIERRRKLPAAEQSALDALPPMRERIATYQEWHDALKAAGTRHLRALSDKHRRDSDGVPAAYESYRRRLEKVNEQTSERLAAVLSDPDPQRLKSKAKEPPVPR